ncbi:MAG: hypothetical protein NT003_00560, partial [Candidatus Magasanikbacteria bacterium]|nr:hypothetical protein [Candidatus Magasanikbacteria bacterium]
MEITPDKKKLIAIIFILIGISALFFLIYKIYFAPAAIPTQPSPSGTEGQPGQLVPSTPRNKAEGEQPTQPGAPTGAQPLPSAAQVQQTGTGSKIVATPTIITDQTAAVTISGDGKTIQYYNRIDGKFYSADANGIKIAMSSESFPAAQSVVWSPSKKIAEMEFPDGSKEIYDFTKQKQYSIPSHWSNIQFSPTSDQIAGLSDSPDPNARFLFTSNLDGTGATPIEPLGDNSDKVTVSWSPNNQVIAFSKTAPAVGGDSDRQGILMIGKNGENFRQLTVEGLGFQPLWTPKGDRILYSAYSGASNLQPTLWIDGGTSDTVGATKNFLNINTWANKCTFMNNDEAICAVPDPTTLVRGIGFAPQLATNTNDTIYKINIRNGLQ